MARQKKSASKSSLTISIIFHTILVLLLVYWAAREGVLGEKMKSITAVIIPKEKKPEPPKEIAKPVEKPKEVVEAKQPEPAQPPPNQPPPTTSTPPPPAVQPSTIAAPPAAVAPSFVFTDGTRPIPVTTNPPVVVAPRARLTPERTFFSPKTNVGTIVQLLETRQKAAAVTDSFGSEQISKSGTSDAADVVTKISGATIVDGKHAVIRGLSDRYNSTTLNGAEVPSADPYRKSVNIDIFNADVIEKIVTTKSFTPDQPGSFTGGAINIVTKSFPSKPFLSFSAGTSYNPQANLTKNFLRDPNGGLDFLGNDPGSRSLPADLANPNLVLPPPPQRATRNETPEEAAARQAQANQLAAYTRSLGTTAFAPVKTSTPLNQSYSGAFGDTIKLFDRPFGFFAGVTYGHNFFSYADGVQGRYGSSLNPLRISNDSRSIEDVSWSSVVNLAYQLHPDHEVSFNFVYSKNSESEAREQVGDNHFVTGNDPRTVLIQDTLHHTERDLQTFLLKGNDFLPAIGDLRLNWLASLSDTTQDEPDLRYFNFYRAPDGNGGFVNYFDNSLPQPIRPSRFFRNLEEKNRNLRLDATLPFQQWAGLEGELKGGVFGSWSDRNFIERTFSYRGDAGFTVDGTPNTYLNSTNLGYTTTVNSTGGTNYNFIRHITSEVGNNKSDGELAVKAGYLMTDMPLANPLRVIAGVRYETTDLSVTGGPIGVPPTSSHIDQADILPAASLIWQITTNMNLRLSYGRTIARPTFREIANYRSYDTTGDEILEGNPDLTLSSIDNFDARWEWFMQSGDLLSVSLFYKDLKDPIEKYLRTLDAGIITYINRESAKVYGIEFEARKNLQFIDPLLRPFSIGANVALIQSQVPLTDVELINKRAFDPGTPSHRPLYDQSPYIVNVDLSYQNIYTHTIATLLYNIAGSRIYIATGQGPDIYEHPGASLDFVLTQQLTRNLRFKFYAKNLLDPVFERTYGDNPGKFVYSSFTRGRTFGLSLSCDL